VSLVNGENMTFSAALNTAALGGFSAAAISRNQPWPAHD